MCCSAYADFLTICRLLTLLLGMVRTYSTSALVATSRPTSVLNSGHECVGFSSCIHMFVVSLYMHC